MHIEATIAKYFHTAPLLSANLLAGIVRSTMKDRNATADNLKTSKQKPAAKRTRAKRVPKPAIGAITGDPAYTVDPRQMDFPATGDVPLERASPAAV